MPSNTFGQLLRTTTFGESHGKAIGAIIDGIPAGMTVDLELLQRDMARRRPGQSHLTTARSEYDDVEILSGVLDNITLGTPIALLIKNKDARSKDYDHISKAFRPSHGDYTWATKFGQRDYRGGGRSSARETAARVAAGAFAKMLLKTEKIEINAFVSSVGNLALPYPYLLDDPALIEAHPTRCPDSATADKMQKLIESVKQKGDTVGGTIQCFVKHCPVGWGEPVFDKTQALLAHAMLSINACKGFEYGSGFHGSSMQGSTHNDAFAITSDKQVITTTNRSGGIQGGITNGMDIYFRCAFKPVSTLLQPQSSIDDTGQAIEIKGKGRHDSCVVPRAVPIVEAMTALVIADLMLIARSNRL